MIKNERQYRITRAQAERFAEALDNTQSVSDTESHLHPTLESIRRDALRSQLADLKADIREYEELKAGHFSFEELGGVLELPRLLISARIASGLSQRELGERLGLKEQQIQRYEASDYASASFSRIRKIASALHLNLDDTFVSDDSGVSLTDIVDRVSTVGLGREFILKRLIPRQWLSLVDIQNRNDSDSILLAAIAESIARIYQWSPQQLLLSSHVQLEPAIEGVRFKVAVTANSERVNAYAVYAHYLALLSIQACTDSPASSLPTDPLLLRSAIESNYGSMSLAAIVNYLWDLGVVVLPLDDPGAFHGACFREDGRNVIVLKQKTSSSSRWSFDCLHEYWHAAQDPHLDERTVLEADTTTSEAHEEDEELTANRFSGAVMLGGRGQELAERCLNEANYDIRRLKSAVRRVADQEGESVDSLANYLAFRLSSEQQQNWWGTANSLQTFDSPWNVVRDVFFERTDFTRLAEPDKELLAQALTAWED